MYTHEFGEDWELAAEIAVADHSTAQDLAARLPVTNYDRIVVIGMAESGSGNTIDVDVEEANALTGGTLQSFDSGNKDLSMGDTDTSFRIEIRPAEFSDGYDWLNIEATPSAARMFGIMVLGHVKNRPATNNFDQSTT